MAARRLTPFMEINGCGSYEVSEAGRPPQGPQVCRGLCRECRDSSLEFIIASVGHFNENLYELLVSFCANVGGGNVAPPNIPHTPKCTVFWGTLSGARVPPSSPMNSRRLRDRSLSRIRFMVTWLFTGIEKGVPSGWCILKYLQYKIIMIILIMISNNNK